MKKIICFAVLLLTINIASALQIIPYVNDFSGVLNESEEFELNEFAQRIEDNSTYEVAMVIVDSIAEDRLTYASRLGEDNGVGKSGQDNGLVVLYVLNGENSGIAIATGRGSEIVFNDAKVGRIIDKTIPLFEQGQYFNSLNLTLTEIGSLAKEERTEYEPDFRIAYILLIIAVVLVFIWSQLRNSIYENQKTR